MAEFEERVRQWPHDISGCFLVTLRRRQNVVVNAPSMRRIPRFVLSTCPVLKNNSSAKLALKAGNRVEETGWTLPSALDTILIYTVPATVYAKRQTNKTNYIRQDCMKKLKNRITYSIKKKKIMIITK